MARLWQEAGYVTMARRAAAMLDAPNASTVNGILAQWSCEQPNPAPWPPIHNNPGNLTRHIGNLGGPIPGVAKTEPGVGLLYVYPTPEAGAEAYARYLLNSSRYHAALAEARGGNGLAFAVAVAEAGYGTNAGCIRSVFSEIGGLPVAHPGTRWQCTAGTVNVRAGAGTDHTIVGAIHRGQVVAGSLVTGSPYRAGSVESREWIALGGGRYTAAAYFRRV